MPENYRFGGLIEQAVSSHRSTLRSRPARSSLTYHEDGTHGTKANPAASGGLRPRIRQFAIHTGRSGFHFTFFVWPWLSWAFDPALPVRLRFYRWRCLIR